MGKRVDVVGRRFGRLEVIEFSHTARAGKARQAVRKFRCKCDCGGEIVTSTTSLLREQTRSCGCLAKETLLLYAKERHVKTHGLTKSKAYSIWAGIKKRCLNPRTEKFHHYGGKGVKVCEKWMRFEGFLEDMGHPPTTKHTIERVAASGNYEPNNCKWATWKEQANNTSRNHRLTVNGESMTLFQAAEKYMIGESVIRRRLKLGWSPERAVIPGDGRKTRGQNARAR